MISQMDLFMFIFKEEIEDIKKTFRNQLTFTCNFISIVKKRPKYTCNSILSITLFSSNSSSSFENNCVKKERVVNTNGRTHLLLTRCLRYLQFFLT